jgi:hypothetical protein
MQQLKPIIFLKEEARAWLNREDGSAEVIKVTPGPAPAGHQCYQLSTAFEQTGENLGSILFDTEGYWIYDGNELQVREQEQVAAFIINYVERI